MANEVLLAAHSLNRHYGAYQALHDVDITLRRGEVLGFLGLNGAGKSTTMKILAGALRPHSGAVGVCGRSLASDPLQNKKGHRLPAGNPTFIRRRARGRIYRLVRALAWHTGRRDRGGSRARVANVASRTSATV